MDSLSLVHPEDRDVVRRNAVKMLKGGSYTPYEFRYINRDGKISWVMETVIYIHYQGRRVTLGNFMDITDRKQAEKKYRQLLEDMNDGYIVVDNEQIVFANRRFEEIYGYETGQILGRSLVELVAPETRETEMALYKK